MKSQMFLLKLNTVSHAYFTLSSILFVLFVTFGKHYTVIDVGAALTFASFILFRRCVMIDAYNHIKQDLDEFDLPFLARDSITREAIKNLVGKRSKLEDETEQKIHKMRLDILKNVDPFLGEYNIHILEDMYNRKIQYIVGNIIIGTTLLNKYNLNWVNILVIVWVLTTFPM